MLKLQLDQKQTILKQSQCHYPPPVQWTFTLYYSKPKVCQKSGLKIFILEEVNHCNNHCSLIPNISGLKFAIVSADDIGKALVRNVPIFFRYV